MTHHQPLTPPCPLPLSLHLCSPRLSLLRLLIPRLSFFHPPSSFLLFLSRLFNFHFFISSFFPPSQFFFHVVSFLLSTFLQYPRLSPLSAVFLRLLLSSFLSVILQLCFLHRLPFFLHDEIFLLTQHSPRFPLCLPLSIFLHLSSSFILFLLLSFLF